MLSVDGVGLRPRHTQVGNFAPAFSGRLQAGHESPLGQTRGVGQWESGCRPEQDRKKFGKAWIPEQSDDYEYYRSTPRVQLHAEITGVAIEVRVGNDVPDPVSVKRQSEIVDRAFPSSRSGERIADARSGRNSSRMRRRRRRKGLRPNSVGTGLGLSARPDALRRRPVTARGT